MVRFAIRLDGLIWVEKCVGGAGGCIPREKKLMILVTCVDEHQAMRTMLSGGGSASDTTETQ
jgi:hypothetical protein